MQGGFSKISFVLRKRGYMAEIKNCIMKNVKISKNSITIKDDAGKTCGVVRDIVSLYDMQANKQIEYFKKLKNAGLHGKISLKNCIISDGVMYVFRNIKSKLWYEKYGFFSDEEKRKTEELDKIYEMLKTAGIEVVECIFV